MTTAPPHVTRSMAPVIRPTPLRVVPVDLLIAAVSLALARWLCLPALSVGDWSAPWLPLAGCVAVSQAASVAFIHRRLGPTSLAVPVAGGTVIGMALGLGVAAASFGLPEGLWPVAASQTWLSTGLLLAWRYAGLWRQATGVTVTGTLVPPRRHEPAWEVVTRQRTLLRMLVGRDLTLKYRGSFFGLLWSLANPLMMTVTYGAVFTYVYPSRVEGFAFLMLLGVLAWTFFSVSARMATSAVVDSGSMVKNVYFPRLVLPSATVLFNFVQLVLALAVLLPACYLWVGRLPPLTLMLVPVALGLTCLFTWGLALVMAATTALFRDIQHLLDIGLQVLFWATPIVYTPDALGPTYGPLLAHSPMAPFITTLRALAYHGQLPDAPTLLLVTVYTGISVAIGLGVFARIDERFAETL